MKTQRRAFIHSVAAACLAAFCVSVQAEPDLLQPDEAFRVSARRVDARVVELEYIIAPAITCTATVSASKRTTQP